MCKKKILFLHAYFFLCLVGIESQQLPFINYTPLDGLANNQVHSMYQDTRGRLYFLTYGGLSVYDGARFTNYTQFESLPIDLVNDVLEITPDSLWLATNTTQLNCLVNGKMVAIKTSDGFYPIINRFFKNSHGKLYVAADEGLFTWQNQQFRKLSFMYEGKDAGRFIMEILEVSGLLLVRMNPGMGEDAGSLFLYDPTSQKILWAEKKTISFHMLKMPDGDVWLSTNKGLRLLKKETLLQGKILFERLPPAFSSVQDKIAYFIHFDIHGQLWLSVYGEGLYVVKPGMDPVHYSEVNGLGSSHISFIYQDKEGNHWFLPEGKGAQKLVGSNIELFVHPFRNGLINDLFADNASDSVWLMSRNTGELILSTAGVNKNYFLPPVHKRSYRIVAGRSSIVLYDQKNVYSGKIIPGVQQISLTQLSSDSCLQAGYGIIDHHGSFIHCADSVLKVYMKNKSSFQYRLNHFADQLAMDLSGQLWIVTRSDKLQAFTIHPEDPGHYLQLAYDLSADMPAINPRSLAIDKSGRIWIGTRHKGLYCFRFSENHLTLLEHFTMKEGMTNNFINFLNVDLHNNIWASSPAGLDKLEYGVDGFVIKNITRENNLYLSFNKVMTDRSGTSWILNESGNLLKVYPETVFPVTYAPLLYLAGIRSGSKYFTEADIIHDFSYRQNNLIFSMAAPFFYNEKQVRYSYLLAGSSNKDWSDPTPVADLNFVNLAPGQYNLKVRTIFPANRYPPQMLSFSFRIRPPWWKTWWFRLLLIVSAALLVIYAIRFYYQRKLEKQRLMLEKKQAIEKERTRIATDMHDDLGAGLSTIRFLSEKVKRNSFSDTTKKDAEKIVSNADELVQKMNEIIWAMNEKNDSLEDLVFYTRAYAMGYCEENGLTCDMQIPEQIPRLFLSGEIRRNVFLTVKESLHNIVKHAAASGVEIRFKLDTSLHVVIHDNGKGMNNAISKSGGNGLRNMQKRIEMIGGKYKVEDGKGVTIEIMVPM